jgi:hypothetical protein
MYSSATIRFDAKQCQTHPRPELTEEQTRTRMGIKTRTRTRTRIKLHPVYRPSAFPRQCQRFDSLSTLLFSTTPQYLILSAFCGDNGNNYPVGPTNRIIPGTQSSVVWVPWAYQQANPATPLAVGTYTLSDWDQDGPTVLAKPGLFSPNSQLRFALYTTQEYTPLASKL